MKFTPQSYEHSPKESSCAECGGAPTSTRSSSPCGRPFNQHTIEGEACLTSSPCPPRSALCCTGACPENLKVSDVSGGTTVETVPGNPCGSSVPDNDPEHAEGRQVPNRETSGATPPVRDLTADDRPCVTSGVPRQGPPLCDSGDLSARTSRPPGMPPTGWMPLTDGFTGATSNGPSETPLPVCPARPGNILNDVSGGYTLIAGLDCPCDGSALRDGSVPPPLIDLPSNFLEFAPSPDILHQQVDEQPSAVEASTSPFHHSRLATPSSPPPHASAAPESTEVKAAPKHGDGSGITNGHAEGTMFLPSGCENAQCVADLCTAPHGNTPLINKGESLAPTPPPATQKHRQSVSDMVSDQLHRFTTMKTPPNGPTERAEIDFPGRFLHLQTAGVGAQVRDMVTNATRWIDDLRRCFPPGGDRAPPLGAIELLMAERTQAYQQEHAKVAMTVHLRTEKRRLELELAVVAEGYLREIGFSATDLCDLTRRVNMLTLQEGGHDSNGNSIISSRTGGTSLYCSSPLYRVPGTKDNKVVDKETTVQTSKLDRDLRAARSSVRQAKRNPFPLVPPTSSLAGTTGGSTPDGSPPPSPPPSPEGSRPAYDTLRLGPRL